MEAENKDAKKPAGPPSSSVDPLIDREKFPSKEPTLAGAAEKSKPSTDSEAPAGGAASVEEEASGGDSEVAGADDISMENLDQLLGANDPTFTAQMEELAAGVQDADVQITGSVDLLSQVENSGHTEKVGPTVESHSRLGRVKARVFQVLGRSKKTAAEVLHESVDQAQDFQRRSKNVLKEYTKRDWKLIALFCVTLVVMGFAFRVVQPVLDQWMKGDFFGNYDKVADQIVNLETPVKMQTFRDPLEEFNFIVQYPRMIVNLKSSLNSTSNPMVTFVIYVEGTSRETAVELKDRQMEIRDICQRVAEGLTYDEFISAEGKRRFKNLVRKDVNEILNAGHLRAIYFDTVIVKP